MNITLERLAVDHPYYCSDSNYYSSKPYMSYETMTEFLDDWEATDEDMNLCFRWGIRKLENGIYSAEVFIIHQRKGIFRPIYVGSVSEDEAIRFEVYAKKHYDVLQQMWSPLSGVVYEEEGSCSTQA